jgi:peptidoglycan-N-acetylglucosamine deacetylase
MKIVFTALLMISFCMTGNTQIVKKQIPDKLIVFTFDDANESQYTIVAPILKQYGFGATFFVCEFPPNFMDSSMYMNWRQIRELGKMGFEVANHTHTHPQLSRLTEDQVVDQIKYIERKCDSIGIAKPVTFAYPGYDLSPFVLTVLKDRSYRFARGGGNRAYDPLKDNPLLVPSWAMTADNKAEIMKAFDKARKGKIVVITIHGVPDAEHSWVTTPPEMFREYVQYLSDNHYKVIAMRDLGQYINPAEAAKVIQADIPEKRK